MSKCLRRMLTPLILLLAISSAVAQTPDTAAQVPSAQKTLTVGVKVAPPFVIEKDGRYSGLAIDLWQEAAADHGWKYAYRDYDLDGLLQAVSDGKVDVGVGAITATAAREKRMDFSHALTSSGLGVAVRNDQTAG